ncbi:EAL domain-containing protein [Methylobacterium sp. Leaf466]|uniref:putative bifunctional diguanylate cyclase/phosphodiesterase n=1 Tax=Methylobacterium sp. Leaf466 TaxID=1736386 RepID=UPI0009E924A1|nr:EAL domain-containing protein [Methylobacterium sp. Leaf466]
MTPSLSGSAAAIEARRLTALRSYRVIDTVATPELGRLTALAAASLGVPMAWVALLDHDTCRRHACVGTTTTQVPRHGAPCAAAMAADEVFVVPDVTCDPRLSAGSSADWPENLRFFAGAALVTAAGDRLGALCIGDTEANATFSVEARQMLASFAALAMAHLDLRRSDVLNAASAGFAKASEYSFIAIDESGTITFVNPAGEALFGYEPGEMIGQDIEIIIPEPFRKAHKVGLARIASGCPTKLAGRTIELPGQRRDGSVFPMEFSMSIWEDRVGIGIGAIMRDISEWRARDAKLVQMAHHDKLTGLINRASFDEDLQTVLAGGRHATVMLLDLDGFKEVNDSLGHAIGDALLQAVAIRLPTCVGGTVTVARFAGDTFALLFPGSGDPLAAGTCAATILDTFQAPFEISGHTFHVSISIGVAIGTGPEITGDELVADADLALYRAKRDGRHCMRLFDPTLRSAIVARRALHDEVTRGLEASEFVLHYQPQVCLVNGRMIGVEALLRWQHPQRGLLLPGAFIETLEAHPLAATLGRWIVAEACRQSAAWRAAGLPPIRVAVNLFGSHLQEGSLAREVMSGLAQHGLPADALEIEVTERIALQADSTVLDPIRELHRLGVAIAFDDFGTGYASLSSLKRFPLNRLKIDRSFVRDILTDVHDAEIVRAILGMAHSFGLDVIAEGIETFEQQEILRRMGCREGQGYLYGKAMAPGAIAALLERKPPWRTVASAA